MMQAKRECRISELLRLLETKHYTQQELWEVLGIWNNIPNGEISKCYRHGKPTANILLNKQMIVSLENR